ncbi:hypothetical protein B0T14DRAFT_106133 [Immersiella caudata]|uniref:Uncharacterized protein n=1 Tax=Immersiella caudata TaxID=314043 RepID=A0AA39X3A4_9PEZI|nr:hypothetical protein B0T14DRAFT_106133 [Immersiella caudata]
MRDPRTKTCASSRMLSKKSWFRCRVGKVLALILPFPSVEAAPVSGARRSSRHHQKCRAFHPIRHPATPVEVPQCCASWNGHRVGPMLGNVGVLLEYFCDGERGRRGLCECPRREVLEMTRIARCSKSARLATCKMKWAAQAFAGVAGGLFYVPGQHTIAGTKLRSVGRPEGGLMGVIEIQMPVVFPLGKPNAVFVYSRLLVESNHGTDERDCNLRLHVPMGNG